MPFFPPIPGGKGEFAEIQAIVGNEQAVQELLTSRLAKGKRGLTIRHPSEILEMQFPEDDCVLGECLMSKGDPFVVCGPSGVGKSRFVSQLAAACITGREFIGFKTRGQNQRWFVLQTENSNRRLHYEL